MTRDELLKKNNIPEWEVSTIGQSRTVDGKIGQMVWMNNSGKYILMGTFFEDDEWAMMVYRYRLKVIDYDIESDTLLMMRQSCPGGE